MASVLLVVAPACFGDDAAGTRPAESGPTPTTDLAVVYNRDVFRNGESVVVHSRPLTLACNPASGDVTDPAAACRALATHPSRFVGRASPSCIGPPNRWSVTITGGLGGQPISRTYDMCAYPEARAWTDLGGTKIVGVVPAGSPRAVAGPKNQ
jgi:hypothetical protein